MFLILATLFVGCSRVEPDVAEFDGATQLIPIPMFVTRRPSNWDPWAKAAPATDRRAKRPRIPIQNFDVVLPRHFRTSDSPPKTPSTIFPKHKTTKTPTFVTTLPRPLTSLPTKLLRRLMRCAGLVGRRIQDSLLCCEISWQNWQ